jgi:hypothetical protein
VDVTDGGGVETLTAVYGTALRVSNVDSLVVDSLDLSWIGDNTRRGEGFRSDTNSDTVLLQNLTINNRVGGIYAFGGSDIQVLSNNLNNNNSRALELLSVNANAIPEAIFVTGNSFTDSNNAVRLVSMPNLIISDGSVPGTDVDLTDGGGVHTLNTTTGTALEIDNLDNVRIDSLDLSWTGDSSRLGNGLRSINNSDTVLVQNLTINNRASGLYINGGSDVQVLNSNLDNNNS